MMTEWQPIETAPKDTVCRVICADGGEYYAERVFHDEWQMRLIDGSMLATFGGGVAVCYPTHWMPLPQPPEEKIDETHALKYKVEVLERDYRELWCVNTNMTYKIKKYETIIKNSGGSLAVFLFALFFLVLGLSVGGA